MQCPPAMLCDQASKSAASIAGDAHQKGEDQHIEFVFHYTMSLIMMIMILSHSAQVIQERFTVRSLVGDTTYQL